jgi:DNA protecting protein DprA
MSADGSAEARPPWWTPRLGEREVLLSLAATPGPLPAAVATWLAEGRDPSSLLRAHSPEPGAVAAQLDALGLRLLVSGDTGWPLSATPPDPPCAWLFTAGPVPPEAAASVAVVGGRRASPLRRVAARSIGAGLARAGWCVVSGGAVGVDAAAHAGALDAGGATVVVLGCGHDVPYPRCNTGLFAKVRAAGGTLLSEHPPGSQPRAANFLPRNRLIAALSAAVVVVEAAEDSGSLSTARAAGPRPPRSPLGSGRGRLQPAHPRRRHPGAQPHRHPRGARRHGDRRPAERRSRMAGSRRSRPSGPDRPDRRPAPDPGSPRRRHRTPTPNPRRRSTRPRAGRPHPPNHRRSAGHQPPHRAGGRPTGSPERRVGGRGA